MIRSSRRVSVSRSLPRLPAGPVALGLWVFLAFAPRALGLVVEMPRGGRPVPILRDAVICGNAPSGWVIEQDRKTVRPPGPRASAPDSVDLRIASDPEACERSRRVVTVRATGPHPEIDIGSVVFAPDEGRLEVSGRSLGGVQFLWRVPGRDPDQERSSRRGAERCLDPTTKGQTETCVVPIERGLPLSTELTWLPANATEGEDVRLMDARGGLVSRQQRLLEPARVVLSQVVVPGATVDVSSGPARIPLTHPGVVAAVDCGAARCEVTEGALVVRSVPTFATTLKLRVRLAPRIYRQSGDNQETSFTLSLPLVQCPLSFASGPPLRDASDAQVVIRVDPRCAKEAGTARWSVNGQPVDDVEVKRVQEVVYAILPVGRILTERAVVAARRSDLDATIIGSVTAETIAAPRPRVTLELPQHGKVEFIPTNRDAVLTVGGAPQDTELIPLSVDGAYSVRPMTLTSRGHHLVRGDENAGGFVALRFAYRVGYLPRELGPVDLAVVRENVQRAVREASVPAPFATSADSQGLPLVELSCQGKGGQRVRAPPGKLYKLAYDDKDTCRLTIYGDRLEPEYGVQEVVLEVEVNQASGSRRSEASHSDRLILVPGAEERVVAIKGGIEEFDRIVVRLSHVFDESRYALSAGSRRGLPSVQWPLAVEGGRFRLYATAAIPSGLYRMNKPTGQLTLNFGVLSRITKLDDRGKENLLGAEVGLMGMGLIQRPGAIDYPPTIGAVAGIGLRVPLGAGAAVGVHVWAVYEFRDDFDYYGDLAGKTDLRRASKIAFIFGPSISIGNVGTNL